MSSLVDAKLHVLLKEHLRFKIGLSIKQTEVALAITEGLTNDEIAEKYGNSVKSIKFHITNINKKLDSKNSARKITYKIFKIREQLLKEIIGEKLKTDLAIVREAVLKIYNRDMRHTEEWLICEQAIKRSLINHSLEADGFEKIYTKNDNFDDQGLPKGR